MQMYRKSAPHAKEFNPDKQSKNSCWRVFSRISENFFVMSRTVDGVSRFTSLYLHTFRLLAPRKLLDAQLFHQKYRRYEDITSIPNRLRWCRYARGLTQEEVAAAVGISQDAYSRLEVSGKEMPSFEMFERLADFFDIPVYDLLDDYHQFLSRGQAQQIRAIWYRLGMSVPQFARHHGIYPEYVYAWENESVTISRKMWQMCFKKPEMHF